MNRPCAFCGGPADLVHHPTGRDHEGKYLDPGLGLPTEHDCHAFVHDDWRHERLDKLQRPRAPIEYVSVRLRRLAMNLARIDQHQPGLTFWGQLAEALQRWADVLDEHVRRLDERDPGWRQAESPEA